MLRFSLLASIGLASLVAGNVLEDDPTVFEPWQITRLTTFSPSGRPGSSPYSVINITIADPNTILAGPAPTGTAAFESVTANCSTVWTFEESPFNNIFNCTGIPHGNWTFEMLDKDIENANPTEFFDVKFRQSRALRTPGGNYSVEFEGTGQFRLGENMEGVCGGSGVCSWGLKNELRPYLINQTRTECVGLCG